MRKKLASDLYRSFRSISWPTSWVVWRNRAQYRRVLVPSSSAPRTAAIRLRRASPSSGSRPPPRNCRWTPVERRRRPWAPSAPIYSSWRRMSFRQAGCTPCSLFCVRWRAFDHCGDVVSSWFRRTLACNGTAQRSRRFTYDESPLLRCVHTRCVAARRRGALPCGIFANVRRISIEPEILRCYLLLVVYILVYF